MNRKTHDAQAEPVAAVAAILIEAAAPAELPMFPALARAYANSVVMRRGRDRPSPVDFGIEDAEHLLTPVLWQAAVDVVAYFGTVAASRGLALTADRVRAMLRRPAADTPSVTAAPAVTLTKEEWGHVHGIVTEVLQKSGMPHEEARQKADSVVAKGYLSDDGA